MEKREMGPILTKKNQPSSVGMRKLQKLVGNALSMLTSDVVNRATTFILYTLVARYLGAFAFGQMSLALTLLYTCQVLAVAGLKTPTIREVARDRTKTNSYLVNGSVIVAVSSLLSMTFLQLFSRLMNYSTDTAAVIQLLSLALLPYALSVICEAVFQAREQMHLIAFANVPVNIAKVSLAFLMLSNGYGLYHLIMLLLISQVVILGVEWWLMLQHITRPRLSLDPTFSVMMIRSTVTFVGIDGVIAIIGSVNYILLSKWASETEVGLYNAATQLLVPLILIYQSTVSSVFPMMCRAFELGFQNLKRIAEDLIELLLAMALPLVVGLFLLSDSALLLLYGNKEFELASGVLRIIVWNMILAALIHVLGQVLMAARREKVTLRIVLINALVNLVLSLVLISQFGLMGAAFTLLLMVMVNFYQHYVPASRLLSGIALGRLVWKPLVASGVMAIYLVAMRHQEIFLKVGSAGVLYVGILLALVIWSTGGPGQFKAKYLYLRSE
jgi:O-antigen/teichoic acid export membrane protein